MKIVADESVDFGIIVNLRKSGFSIYSIAEKKSGIDDTEALQIAAQ
jgi:hypothetical protein